jgi:hypothetical protein
MGFWMVRSRKCNLEAVVGALAFLLTTASAAHAVPVSLPVNAVINSVGQTTVVNVTIGSVANVEGLGLSITFSEAVADVMTVGNVQRGPLTQNCDSTVINIADPGRLTITAACFSTPISGSGTLFAVTFTGTGNGATALTFSTLVVMGEVLIPNGCLLNEGSPTCEPMNGQLTVGQAVPTNTASATRTNTATRTPTNTVPPVNTQTRTNTPIITATRTNTVPGATATHTVALATATSSATRSNTPTVTDTPTSGPSPTASNTTTPVNTGTVTQTPSITGTFTDTPTAEPTATITATGTITSTGTVTRTRPGIPVVPSPMSPAGAAMITGLGVAMVWALRRLYRP